jgi:hypothetical protein
MTYVVTHFWVPTNKIKIYNNNNKKKKNLNSVGLTLLLYPPRALPKSREPNLDSHAQWPTSRSMICSQDALAKGTSSFPPYKKERPRKKVRRGGEMGRTRGRVLNEREGSFETERGGKF